MPRSPQELPRDLADKWNEAEATGERIAVGDSVVCDGCNQDFTHSGDCGGFIFGSYGYGPCCASRMLADIVRFGEEDYIRARCPEGKSFADFVRENRGPNSYIQIT